MYAHQTLPMPPAPSNPEEARRWEHTRHRRALMEGRWSALLEARLQAQLGTVRRAAWGLPDLSSNPFRVVAVELSTLYDAAPDIRHNTDAEAAEPLIGSDGEIARSGLWSQMSRFQSMAIALREMWMRVDVENGRISYRPVSPDMTIAESDPARPTVPVSFAELRPRLIDGKNLWTWDVFDVRNPDAPSYRVHIAGDGGTFGKDVTEQVLGGSFSGEAYPYRRADGTPVLPVVLYHAALYGDRLFDPYYGIELYEGALNLSVYYSYLGHCLRDASYPQRYAVGVRVAGMEQVDGGSRAARAEVVTDPTTILMFDPVAETTQPMISQFQAGADVEKIESTIAAIAHRLATDAGLSPSELQRVSGSAKSGYAISLSNEGKRTAQRKYILQFQSADEELIALSAILLNRATGTAYPESNYRIHYREIPLSPEELQARRTHVMEMMSAGLMDRVEALRYFGSLSEQDAVIRLKAIDELNGKAPPAPLAEGANRGEAAPAADVSRDHAEMMDEAVDEVRASEEAIAGLLDGTLTDEQREVLSAVLESMREARGYLTGQDVEASVELPGEAE
jgi:hypothetical protein